MPSPPQRESRGRALLGLVSGRPRGTHAADAPPRQLPTLPGLTPPPPPQGAALPRQWVAGYPPSLPLRQVALHEAALQHGGLPEEQVPPVLEQDLVTRLLRLRAGARVKAMGLGLGMGSGPG